jgi:hypothetical protein
MEGFRAAGWTCFATAAMSFVIGTIGLQGIGYVGKTAEPVLDEGERGPGSGLQTQTQTVDIPMEPLSKPVSHD